MNKQTVRSSLSNALGQVRTRKKEFLAQMGRNDPWKERVDLTQPCDCKGERGNKPCLMETMLRLYLLQYPYNLSDEAAAELVPGVNSPWRTRMKTCWKGIGAAVLALCSILLCVVPACAASQALHPAGAFDGLTRPASVAAMGQSLWALTGGSLYRVALGDESGGETVVARSGLPINSRIACRDGALFLLAYQDQALSLYTLEQEAQVCNACGDSLSCEGFFAGEDEQRFTELAAFAPLTDTSWAALLWTGAESGMLLYGDSGRGTIREVAVPSVVSIAPAGETSVYASLATGELRQVDVSTGGQTVLAQLEQPAYCLAAAEDGSCLYFADMQQVYRYTEHSGIEAYGRSPIIGQGAWLPACVAGERYVLGDSSGLFVVEQPDTALPLLTIAGNDDKRIVQDFETNHNVRVLMINEHITFQAEDLMQSMITQNDAYDLYLIEVSTGCLSVLLQKGYYVPLDASETLTAALDAMDPHLTALLKQDQHYAAFPKAATAEMLCVNTNTMREFGLTEEELPRTFSEFLPWLAAQYEKSQELGRTVWDMQRSLRHSAFTLLLGLYIEQCEKDHVTPDFISYDFPALLAQIDQYFMDSTPLQAPGMLDGEPEVCLLGQQDMGDAQAASQGWIPLPLALSADFEPIYDVQLKAYVINPFSKHQEEALAYLETLHSYQDMETALASLEPVSIYAIAETKMLLSGTPVAPVERPEYADEYVALVEQQEQLSGSLDALEPQAFKDAQMKIREIDVSLGFLEQLRWYVSPADIERVESYRPFFHARGESTFFALATSAIAPYANQYAEGLIDTQEMLQQLQRLARMVQLEAQ